jgi:cardiolipin synthase
MTNGHEMQVDGYLARRFNMHSVLGTILDPAADKALMTTLTVALAVKGMLPRMYPPPLSLRTLTPPHSPVWLATIIIGRDALLSLSAFYIRYTSLPHPVSGVSGH